MSKDAIERFAGAVRADKALQEELKKAASSNEALVEFARGHGYEVNLDELVAYIEKRKATLSEQDLDKVAGGKSHTHTHTQAEVTAAAVAFEAEAAATTTTAVSQAEVVIIAT